MERKDFRLTVPSSEINKVKDCISNLLRHKGTDEEDKHRRDLCILVFMLIDEYNEDITIPYWIFKRGKIWIEGNDICFEQY